MAKQQGDDLVQSKKRNPSGDITYKGRVITKENMNDPETGLPQGRPVRTAPAQTIHKQADQRTTQTPAQTVSPSPNTKPSSSGGNVPNWKQEFDPTEEQSTARKMLDPAGIFAKPEKVKAETGALTKQQAGTEALKGTFAQALQAEARKAPQAPAPATISRAGTRTAGQPRVSGVAEGKVTDLVSAGPDVADIDVAKLQKITTGAAPGAISAPAPITAGGPTLLDRTKLQEVSAGPAVTGIAGGVGTTKTADVAAESAGVEQAKTLAQQAALGTAPSAAEQLLRQNAEQIIKQQAALAASRGYSAAAQREAARSGVEAMQAAGQQASQLRAQEMATARKEYADIATTSRQQIAQLSMADVQNKISALGADQQSAVTQRAQNLQAQGMNQEQAMKAALADQDAYLKAEQARLQAEGMNADAALKAAMANQSAVLSARGQDLQAATANAENELRAKLQNQQSSLTNRAQNLQASGMNADNIVKTLLSNKANDVAQRAQDLQAQGLNAQIAASLAQADADNAIKVQLSNLDAQLKQQGMDDAMRQQYISSLTALQGAQLSAAAQEAALKTQAQTASAEASQKAKGGILSAAGAAIGSIFSDPKTKKGLKEAADKDVESFIDALRASTFEYRDGYPGAGAPHLGVRTDDLEKSKFGKQLVSETPEGKKVNIEQSFAGMLAALANQQKRIRKLEKKGGK